jgi:hypothetical protein
MVILDQGVALAWFDTRSGHLVTFGDRWATMSEALVTLVKDGRARAVEVRKVNGVANNDLDGATHEALGGALCAVGFTEGYRGWVLRS